MRAVPAAMARAAADAGVDVRLSTGVEEVTRRSDGSASGVRLAGGETLAADAVVFEEFEARQIDEQHLVGPGRIT